MSLIKFNTHKFQPGQPDQYNAADAQPRKPRGRRTLDQMLLRNLPETLNRDGAYSYQRIQYKDWSAETDAENGETDSTEEEQS